MAKKQYITEEWRPVVGYEKYYEVSDHGRVRSLDRLIARNDPRYGVVAVRKSGRVMRPGDSMGYPACGLVVEGVAIHVKVHRLVAEAFLPNPNGWITVNHIDGNKQNNHVSNLEWASYTQNNIHGHETGLIPVGEKRPNAKLTEGQVRKIRAGGKTDREFAEEFGVSSTPVSYARLGWTWRHVLPCPPRTRPSRAKNGR